MKMLTKSDIKVLKDSCALIEHQERRITYQQKQIKVLEKSNVRLTKLVEKTIKFLEKL